MPFMAWFYLAVGMAFLVRILREAAKPSEKRSTGRIVTDILFLVACIYMLLGRLGAVPRI